MNYTWSGDYSALLMLIPKYNLTILKSLNFTQ